MSDSLRWHCGSSFTHRDDVGKSTNVALWSAVEPCAGIISACMPSLRPLISLSLRGINIKVPTFHRGNITRPDSGASTMPWIREAKERSQSADVEMQWPQNTLVTVPSAMSRVTSGKTDESKEGKNGIQVEELHVPYGAIKVKTEIRWSVTERLDYHYRVY